jgi:phenylacetate-CoA ligase
VSFYGANVYPENVAVGLEQPALAASLTGKFVLEVQTTSEHGSVLGLVVELALSARPPDGFAELVAEQVRRQLERVNSEFAHYVPEARRTPRIELRAFADPEYFPSGVKHRYTRQ